MEYCLSITLKSPNGTLPIAISKKSSLKSVFSNPFIWILALGYNCFAILPVRLSSSTPYKLLLSDNLSGSLPKKLPTPQDGSNIFPPSKPKLFKTEYIVSIINGLV